MKIGRPKHKGLRRFVERGDVSRLPSASITRIADALSLLMAIKDIDELHAYPRWRAHTLKGDRLGQTSMTISGNWRLVFRYDYEDDEIRELDLIDYH